MQDITKVKLVLIAFCLVPIAYSVGAEGSSTPHVAVRSVQAQEVYNEGYRDGVAQADKDAITSFNSLVIAGQAVKEERKAAPKQTKTAKAPSLWTVVDNR